MTNKEFAEKIAYILDEKNIKDLTLVDVSEKSTVTYYFVLGTARTASAVKAAADYLEEQLDKQGIYSEGKDGVREGRWIVLDYSEVMVHIFTADLRAVYKLENLWAEPGNVNITEYKAD